MPSSSRRRDGKVVVPPLRLLVPEKSPAVEHVPSSPKKFLGPLSITSKAEVVHENLVEKILSIVSLLLNVIFFVQHNVFEVS